MNTDVTAEIWLDPLCPWAYMTYRWIDEVSRLRSMPVTVSVMSLSILNEGREDLPAEYRELMDRAWGPPRVLAAVAHEHGTDTMVAMYRAMTRRIHHEQRKDYDDVCVEAAKECGLDESLVERAHAGDYDASLRASHQRAMDLVGDEVGTPVIAVGDVAFFGPVVSPHPQGDDALRLWDGCVLVASTPGFFELKRSRTVGPQFPED